MKRAWKQIGSLFMAVCMILTMLPMTAFAETGDKDSGAPLSASGIITAFAELDTNMSKQTVKTGTPEKELDLPGTLAVTVTESVYDVATGSDTTRPETKTTVAVSGWTADPEYNGDTVGIYTFTPSLALPEGLTIAEGVSVPSITVTIGQLPKIALMGQRSVMIGTTGYSTLTAALEAATNGDTITLLTNITEAASNVNASADIVTIDGGGYTLTGPDSDTESIALTLTGTGTVVLKDLTLQGGISTGEDGVSTGLKTGGTLDIRSFGTVTAKGGAAGSSFGLDNWSTGTVDVTAASASGTCGGYGVVNESSGAVNVGLAESGGTGGVGVSNAQGGTINVTTATGSTCGAINQNTGTVNITTASGNTYGIYNTTTGTVNATTITSSGTAVKNDGGGKVNAKTISNGTFTTTTNMNVASVTLNKGTSTSCVLNSIIISAQDHTFTTIGMLPSVYKDGEYSNAWYSDSTKATAFSDTSVPGATTFYSDYYEAPKMVEITKNSTTTYYPTLTAALAAAADGDVVVLKENITEESVSYTVSADKTITINGGGNTLTASSSAALALSGTGIVILKDLTLQGRASSGTSTGLDVSGDVDVQSYGTVTANGSAATASSSYGVTNSGTGTVDVTEAVAAGTQLGAGAYNIGSGTINVGSATGSGAMIAVGAYNYAGGTINVTTASGSRDGVINRSNGTVNVTTATKIDSADPIGSAVTNMNRGTVNAGTASGGLNSVSNISTGTVNVRTITGTTTNSGGGTVNTGNDVTAIPLHVGTDESCVLGSITIAKNPSGTTQIGTLPNVYKGSACNAQWYTGVALTNQFTMQEISSEATLYSSFYTIETAEDVAAYITEVSGLTASASGSTVTVTGTATLTSTSDAALTIDIPADVKVVWKASLSGGGSKYLLAPAGDGTFEVADRANIVNDACQVAIYCYDGKGNLIITGGSVSTTGAGMAIGIAGGWRLTMTGGKVSANTANSGAIFGKNSVVITGGTVSAAGTGGFQLYMSGTSVYRGSVLDPGKIMYHTSGIFAEVSIDAAVTQAQPDKNTGLTVKGHNLTEGNSVTAVWAKQNGVSGVRISYYKDSTTAYDTEFLAVPGVTLTDTGNPTDSVPPTVTSVTPSGTGAAVNGNVAIIFSEPMNTVSGAVYLSSDGGGSYGSALTGGSWSVSDSVYTVPYSGLSYSKTCFIKVEGFKDIAGNVMSMDTSQSFTTMAKPSTGNGTGGGGGSSSGGSSGGTTTTTTPEKKPDQPVTATVPVTATAGTNGTASAAISDKAITDAIDKAQADAKAQGKTANGTTVALDVTMPKGSTSLTATLTQSSLNSLVSAGVSQLELDGAPVSLGLDLKALQEIQKQSGGSISITIAPATRLSKEAQVLLGNRPVYNFTISYVKDGKTMDITSLGIGTATLSIPYTPGRNEAVGYLFGVYVDAKGKAQRIAGSAYDANSGSLMIPTGHFSVYGVGYTAPNAKFTDIGTHWGKEAIDYVVGRGLLSGTSEITFAPDIAMTRGMLVTALGRLAGVDAKAYTTNSFTDVKADSALRPYIEWAYKKGIIQGIENQQFAPDWAITREEIAVIFSNFAKATGYTLPVTRIATTYADDSSIGSTYKTAVTAMQQAGIIVGENNSKFNPRASATRAEVSTMLYRYIKLTIDPATAQGWAQNDDGQRMYYKDSKALIGWQTINGKVYCFDISGAAFVNGWKQNAKGEWFLLSSDGSAVTGWKDISANGTTKRNYFDANGVMVAGKWLEIDGKWYYFYADGALAKSTKVDGYEVDENGVRKTK